MQMSAARGKPVGPDRLLNKINRQNIAEIQVHFPNLSTQIEDIRSSIFEPRFATYFAKGCNHEEYVLAQYLYNGGFAIKKQKF